MSSKKKSSSNEQKENTNEVPLSPYEGILACRSNPPGPPEYLVKLRDKSYQKSKWISSEDLQKNPQSSSMLTRFIKNQREYPIEPPYYDPKYDIIDRIIRKKDRKYFVKWMGLGYEQATWEKTVSDEALEDFKHRQLQVHPLKSGDVNKLPSINVQQIISYTFGEKTLESYQVATMNLLINNYSKMKNTDIIDRYNSQLAISCAAFFEYILQNTKENNNTINTRSTRRTRSQKNDDNEFTDSENGGEYGPVLIVAPKSSINKWYDAFRSIKIATTLNYSGSGRQVAVDNDFYHSEDRLKFHVLITTPEILAHDMELLSEIKWRIGIFDEANRLRNPQSKLTKVLQHFVLGTQIAIMQNAPNYFALKKLTDLLIASSTNPYISEDFKKAAQKVRSQIQPKVLKRKNALNVDDEKETFSTYYIDCPLSVTQKKILRNIIRDAARFVQKKNFIPLCQRILRICSHPFLLYSQEYMGNGVDLIKSSTKLSALEELLIEKISSPNSNTPGPNRILIMSNFSLMLDMIQDVATSHNIVSERIITASKEVQHEDAQVFLYNPKYCGISPSLLELMNTIIIFDGDSFELEEMLRAKKPLHLQKVYKFQCHDCSEERLSRMCIINNVNTDEIKPSQYESICKLSALAAFSEKKIPDAKSLLSKATVVKNSFNSNEVLEQEFENCDFWSYLVDDKENIKEQGEIEYENSLVNSNEQESTNHEWTCRERDQLLRGLCRFGFNRWKEMRIQTGLRISVKNVVSASRALVREMIRILGSGSGHAVSREFIKESSMLEDDEASDKEFINSTCFSASDFKSDLSNNHLYYLREIENIHFLGESVKDKSEVYEISLPHPPGPLPRWWKEEYDRYLVYGTWKYGLGCYEQFVEDSNQELQKIFGPSDDPIDQRELTERVMKLADAIKRKQSVNQRGEITEKAQSKKDNAAYQPPSSNQVSQASQGSQSDSEFSSSNSNSTYTISSRSRKSEFTAAYDSASYGAESTSRGTREEKHKMYQYLIRYGVPEDSKGNPDYETFARESELISTRTVDDVKVMVEDYLAKCKIPPEEGGNAPNTSSKINQRCEAMRQLREIMRDDERALRIFENAPHWRQLPKEWTPEVEYRYFREILQIGLVNDAYQKIIKSKEFQSIFGNSQLPSFIYKDVIVMKRIKVIYSSMVEDNKNGTLNRPIKITSTIKSNHNVSNESKKKSVPSIKNSNIQDNSIPKKSKIKMPCPEGYVIQLNRSLFPADRAIFDGRVKVPLNLGHGKVILRLGKIIPEQEDFQTERYIYPIGFKVANILPSATKKGTNTSWINEITLEGYSEDTPPNGEDQDEDEPEKQDLTTAAMSSKLIFKAWMEEEPEKVYEGETPNAVWGKISDDINALNENSTKTTISGIDAFLLSNQSVTYLIQHMKGSKRCHKYKAKEVSLPEEAQKMREWTQFLGVPFGSQSVTSQASENKQIARNSRSKKDEAEKEAKKADDVNADIKEEEEEEAEEEEEEEEIEESEEEEPSYKPKSRQTKATTKSAASSTTKTKQNTNNDNRRVNTNNSNTKNSNKKQNNQMGPNMKTKGGMNTGPIGNMINPSVALNPMIQAPGQFGIPQANVMPNFFQFNQGNLMPNKAIPNQLLKSNLIQPNMIQNGGQPPNMQNFFGIPQNVKKPPIVQNNLPQGFIPQPGFIPPNQMPNFIPQANVMNNNSLIQNNNQNQQKDQTQAQIIPPLLPQPLPQQPDPNIQAVKTEPNLNDNNSYIVNNQ